MNLQMKIRLLAQGLADYGLWAKYTHFPILLQPTS